jgi:hypothetical protein
MRTTKERKAMHSKRRFLVTCAIAALATAALLPGSGLGSRATSVRGRRAAIPAGLANAIHARLGVGTLRTRSSSSSLIDPILGLSVALSADGTTALVGAPGVGDGRGAAYIFHSSGAGSWTSSGTPTATLTSKHGTARGLFGFAVALSADGTTAFVGAPGNGNGLLFPPGAIYAFHVSTENAWASSSTPSATLTANNGMLVGWAIALSPDGTTLIAGAPAYNDLGGGAYVYHVSSEGAWASTSNPTAALSNASEGLDDGGVGSSVAISGDGMTALLGDAGNPNGGGAYLYHASAENAWTTSAAPTAILSNLSSGANDSLGNAVALSSDGTLALLGAPGANSSTGAADVFHSSGAWTSTSTPTATLTKAGGSHGDGFGVNLTVSNDGMTAFAFAPGVNTGRGAVHVFRASGEAAWADSSAPTATLTASGGHANDNLGIGVLSSDGATLLAGAPGVNVNTGAAYMFHVADASSWVTSSTTAAALTDKALAACVVPKLKGLKLTAAKSVLAVGRCRLGKVTKAHSKKGHGRVLSQKFKPGKRLAIHAKVPVKVAK